MLMYHSQYQIPNHLLKEAYYEDCIKVEWLGAFLKTHVVPAEGIDGDKVMTEIESWEKVSNTSSEDERHNADEGLEDIYTQQENIFLSEHRDLHLTKAPDWRDVSPTSQGLASQAGIS